MDKFKFSLFDIFSYTIPGLIVLICCYFLNNKIDPTFQVTIGNMLKLVDELKINSIILILIVSFIFGHVLHFFGYNYFNLVGKTIWKKSLHGKEKGLSRKENKYVLVRQFSKENYLYIELWHASRAMAFNLSLSVLLLSLTVLIKIIGHAYFNFEWIAFIIGSLTISFVMLRRAVTFHVWSYDLLEAAINTLKLHDKVIEVNTLLAPVQPEDI